MTLDNLKKLSDEELNERFPFMVCYDMDGKPITDDDGKIMNHFSNWGWRDIQLALAEHLLPIYNTFSEDPNDADEIYRGDFFILQTKEKWGRLRTDFTRTTESVMEWCELAEYISSYTCIDCGKTTKISDEEGYSYCSTHGWILPYCKDCIGNKSYQNEAAKPYLEMEGYSQFGPEKTKRYEVDQFWELPE